MQSGHNHTSSLGDCLFWEEFDGGAEELWSNAGSPNVV